MASRVCGDRLCTPGWASRELAGALRSGFHRRQEEPCSFLPETLAASLVPVPGLRSRRDPPLGSLHVSISAGLGAAAPGGSAALTRCGNKHGAFGSLPFVVRELCMWGQAQAR